MDYMFMSRNPDHEDRKCPILVIKERQSGGVWSLAVVRKGAKDDNIINRVCNIINDIGAPKLIIKSDQEPAMIDLKNEIRKEIWNEHLQMLDSVKSTRESKHGGGLSLNIALLGNRKAMV